jgi:hypothetical protein
MSASPAAAAPAVTPRRRPSRGGRPTPAPAPRRAPVRPRRVSGPARARNVHGFSGAARPALARALRGRLDRLIHGRAWIGVVAFALIGIVTMQLGLLKLNAGIGRALEHEAMLQRENSALSVEDSELAAGDAVEAQAGQAGMRLIAPGTLRFLSVQGSDDYASKARAALNAAASASASAAAASAAAGSEQQASGEAAAGESSLAGSAEASTGSAEADSGAGETSAESGETSAASGETSAASGETSAASAETSAAATEPGATSESSSAPGEAQG